MSVTASTDGSTHPMAPPETAVPMQASTRAAVPQHTSLPTPGSSKAPHAYEHHVPDTSPTDSHPASEASVPLSTEGHPDPEGHHSAEPPPLVHPPGGTLVDRCDKLLACTASLPDNLLQSIYLIDTGTQITLVCSMQHMTNTVELPNPLAWGGATDGAVQFASHKGDLTIQLGTEDGKAHPVTIPGAFYSATARLNAVSTSDLIAAEVSLQLDTDKPGEATVIFNGSCHTRREAKVKWIETLPFLPISNFQERTGNVSTLDTPSIFSCMLGRLPPADYMHLIFDHCPKEVLQRILARTVGLASKTLKFCHLSGKCHTCIETRGRTPDSNDSDLPELVLEVDDLWCMDLINFPNAP